MDITISQIYNFVLNATINDVVAYYVFVFVIGRLIKYILDIEVKVLSFDMDKRILSGSVLGYLILNIIPIKDTVEFQAVQNLQGELSFLIISTAVLFIFILVTKFLIVRLISPATIYLKILHSIFNHKKEKINNKKSFIKKYVSFVNGRLVLYEEETGRYIQSHLLNLIAVLILSYETMKIDYNVGFTALIFGSFFLYLEWKHSHLQWPSNITQDSKFQNILTQ